MGRLEKLSIFISLVLRHKPDAAKITLDEHGWANVRELINGINATGRKIDFDILEEIVRTDTKQRYSFNEDRSLIRANQGHSIPVDVELMEQRPPEYLFHGTSIKFLGNIKNEGLKPMSRLYVHLSDNIETARKVGSRHGKPVVLKIRSSEMFQAGYKFYLSKNNVWLTKLVNAEYIGVLEK